MNILIVPPDFDDGLRGSTTLVSNADVVLTTDGRVVKDRNGDTWVKVIEAPEPEPLTLSRRVAVSPNDIRSLLTLAIESEGTVEIAYRKSDGILSTRTIRPHRLEWGHIRVWEYVTAYDVEKAEPRTFRLDRIESVEVV
jgi:hypothetical protein